MSEKKLSDQEIASAIAEAIRAKRGGRQSCSAEELAAQEATLLADLESFQDSKLDDLVESEPARPPVTNVASGSAFPEIGRMGVNPPKENTRPQPVDQPAPPVLPPAASGLLAQLKQQAEQVNLQNSVQSKISAETAQQVDAGLHRVFEYINDLVMQLNVLHPVITRAYTLFGVIEFKDLVWQRGFVGYRSSANKMGDAALLESVNFSFNLKADREVVLEREASAIESLSELLYDNGVVFRCQEKRNQRQMVESATFYLAPEIKATLCWRADIERRGVVLEARNFERFGDMRYFLSAEVLTQEMLEEFGRLLLGQANRFRDFARR